MRNVMSGRYDLVFVREYKQMTVGVQGQKMGLHEIERRYEAGILGARLQWATDLQNRAHIPCLRVYGEQNCIQSQNLHPILPCLDFKLCHRHAYRGNDDPHGASG